jgi:hypothetical protein
MSDGLSHGLYRALDLCGNTEEDCAILIGNALENVLAAENVLVAENLLVLP